jgi:hypothetical protein
MCSAVRGRLTLRGRSKAELSRSAWVTAVWLQQKFFQRKRPVPGTALFRTTAVVEEFAKGSCVSRRATTSNVTQFLFGRVVAPPARVTVP